MSTSREQELEAEVAELKRVMVEREAAEAEKLERRDAEAKKQEQDAYEKELAGKLEEEMRELKERYTREYRKRQDAVHKLAEMHHGHDSRQNAQVTTVSSMNRISKPKAFDENGDIEIFLKRFENYCDGNHIVNDTNKKCLLLSLLSEDAYKVYLALNFDDIEENYTSVKEVLTERFTPVCRKHEARVELRGRTQRPEESLDQFLEALVELATRSKYPAAERTSRIIEGFCLGISNQAVKRAVYALQLQPRNKYDSPPSIKEYVAAAKKEELLQKITGVDLPKPKIETNLAVKSNNRQYNTAFHTKQQPQYSSNRYVKQYLPQQSLHFQGGTLNDDIKVFQNTKQHNNPKQQHRLNMAKCSKNSQGYQTVDVMLINKKNEMARSNLCKDKIDNFSNLALSAKELDEVSSTRNVNTSMSSSDTPTNSINGNRSQETLYISDEVSSPVAATHSSEYQTNARENVSNAQSADNIDKVAFTPIRNDNETVKIQSELPVTVNTVIIEEFDSISNKSLQKRTKEQSICKPDEYRDTWLKIACYVVCYACYIIHNNMINNQQPAALHVSLKIGQTKKIEDETEIFKIEEDSKLLAEDELKNQRNQEQKSTDKHVEDLAEKVKSRDSKLRDVQVKKVVTSTSKVTAVLNKYTDVLRKKKNDFGRKSKTKFSVEITRQQRQNRVNINTQTQAQVQKVKQSSKYKAFLFKILYLLMVMVVLNKTYNTSQKICFANLSTMLRSTPDFQPWLQLYIIKYVNNAKKYVTPTTVADNIKTRILAVADKYQWKEVSSSLYDRKEKEALTNRNLKDLRATLNKEDERVFHSSSIKEDRSQPPEEPHRLGRVRRAARCTEDFDPD